MKKTPKWCTFNFGDETNEQPKSAPTTRNNKTKKPKLNHDKTIRKQCDINFNAALTPQIPADLAVHPKKIKEVENWLETNINSNQFKATTPFLLITGPTGAGKTATINVLCRNSNITINEWINPMDWDYDVFRGQNQIERFREFLIESKWNSIYCSNNDKKLILIEELPNAILRNPNEFHEILEDIFYKNSYPTVFICTDICNDKGVNVVQSLFPTEILNRYKITQISFNACAPTVMKIALKRAQSFVETNKEQFKVPNSSTIDAILTTSNGDIRSAINQFYFASLLGSNDLPLEDQKPNDKLRKRKRNSATITRITQMQRDDNLGLFHSLGKVFNPKRYDYKGSWRLDCNLDKLIDEFSIKPHLFVNFLHENYLKYFGDLNDIEEASDWLSLSQTFLDKWTEREETLMFALWIGVLGLMVTNRHRLSLWTQIRAPTKIKKTVNIDEDTRNLSPTDLYYYNKIKNIT